jgi:RHS repeat-associated protein
MYIEPFTGKGHTLYRDYDALHNMWLSRDPIAEQGGINLTGYCNGNAVDGCDPLGLADTPVGKIVEAVTPFYYIEKYSQFCADSARWIGRKVPVLEKPMESVAFASDFNANAIGTLNVANQVEGFSGTSANRIETDKIIYKRSEGQAVGNALNLALLDINPVAQIIQGTYGKSLEPTSPMVEMSGAEQATRISGGIGGTAGIVAGGLRFAPAIESKIASMRTQTPSPTTPPNGVSQPTETVILSGHGSLEGLNSSPVMQLPKNTSLTVLTEHGGRLPNSIANMIEANGQVTRAMLEIYPELQGARTYLPESFVPDYTLWPLEDSMVIGNPMRVSQATTLSQLIKPNKNYIWNACARDRVKVVVK